MAKSWRRPSAKLEEEKKQGGILKVGTFYSATDEALAPIQELLGDSFEALPINIKPPSKLKQVWLLHPLVTAKLTSKAKVERWDDGGIMDVEEYHFAQKELEGKHFFCVDGGGMICTPKFREMIEANGITGFGFEPLPGYES
jgi:hypothetical protein